MDCVGCRRRVHTKVLSKALACAGERGERAARLPSVRQRRHEDLERALVIRVGGNDCLAHLAGSGEIADRKRGPSGGPANLQAQLGDGGPLLVGPGRVRLIGEQLATHQRKRSFGSQAGAGVVLRREPPRGGSGQVVGDVEVDPVGKQLVAGVRAR